MDVQRYGIEPDYVYGHDKFGPVNHVTEKPYYVLESAFDRVTAERDALQLRLNAVEEENDRLRKANPDIADSLHHMTIRAIAAEELIDVCDCSNTPQPIPSECAHEWIDDGLHTEVCALCGTEENFEGKSEKRP